jgi:DNA mismatch endonuclease (patch repair protein)
MAKLAKLAPRRKRDALTRSEVMSRIRSQDTLPEMMLRSELRRIGVHYRAHVAGLPGRPDFSNKSKGWVLFVHGCFWHSHDGCRRGSKPKSNIGYWGSKLRRNKERDADKCRELANLGLQVFVVWECEVRSGLLRSRIQRLFSEIKQGQASFV